MPSYEEIYKKHEVEYDELIALFTTLLAAGSVWLVLSAVRTLGKQWAIAARLVNEHTLITHGPYSIVRNPIYAGMFGMMVATALVVSEWFALTPAVVLFIIGANLCVKAEEKLVLTH